MSQPHLPPGRSPQRAAEEWFLLAVVALFLPTAALVGWLVSRLASPRARLAVAWASVALAVLGAVLGGPSPRTGFNLLVDVAVIAAIISCTATGLGSILGWAVRLTVENLTSVGRMLIRALPVMLLTMLVFFNTAAWSMAATLSRGRLWVALGILVVIAVAFLTSSTANRLQPTLAPEAKRAEPAGALDDTAFARLPDRPNRVPLSRRERVNVVFVVTMSELVQILTVAVVTGLIFLVFGLVLVSPELLSVLTHGGSASGQVLGMTLPIPEALIQIVMFMIALTFMYLAANTVSNDEYRAQFLDPQLDELQVTLAARDRYRAYTASDRAEAVAK